MKEYDIVVIGGGPAGLASSLEASKNSKVLLIEREDRLGGILKQCIHNGFGLITFKEQLSGPEYVERYISQLEKSNVEVLLSTFLLNIEKMDSKKFKLTISNKEGVSKIVAKSLIFSTGCRERSPKQVYIQGDRVSGVMSAGLAQYYVNILGEKIGKNIVILGSGDIGLIMARRLTLEGSKVLGVYEIKPIPSGLSRNISQCLNDFNIPLYLSTTVTKTFGKDRLEAVEVAEVDSKMNVIENTKRIIKCDTLILSVGLIPENEALEKLGIEIDRRTNGAVVDGQNMTSVDNVYACGNCLHVHDLVDYVSESSIIAGKNASNKVTNRKLVKINPLDDIAYVVPQRINVNADNNNINIYFRSKNKFEKKKVFLLDSFGNEIYSKNLMFLNPAEMIKITVDLNNIKEDIDIKLI